MKIQFLGTGAAEGIPALRCLCPACRTARIKKGPSIRQNACIYLEGDQGERLLIDFPSHCKASLNDHGIKDTDITDLILTHYHQDHTNGFFFLAGSPENNGIITGTPLNVHLSRDTLQSLSGQFNINGSCSFHLLEDQKGFSVGSLKITPLETGHLSRPEEAGRRCFGFLFDSPQHRFAYLADSSMALPEASREKLKERPLACLILECTFADNPESRRHFDIAGVLALHSFIQPERMILTHISHRNYDHEPLTELMEPYHIEVAWDGRIITL